MIDWTAWEAINGELVECASGTAYSIEEAEKQVQAHGDKIVQARYINILGGIENTLDNKG